MADVRAHAGVLPAQVRVAVIGAGFGGIGAAIRLAQAGERDVVVLEKAASVGGVWRDNTYPGAACDVPSHLYSFSFAPNPDWQRSFSPQPEIRRYLEDVTDRFGVRPQIHLGCEVQEARWDDDRKVWRLRTSLGPLVAQVIVSAAGPLHEPSRPDVPGLADFPGTVFHSARWRHDHDLTGERVAVIGTGASAIQLVPRIAPKVGRLHVFQRTPPWVMPRVDRPTTAAERWLFRHVPPAQRLARASIYASRELNVAGLVVQPRLLRLLEVIGRGHLRAQVRDRALRDLLTPRYRAGCKRLLLSNTYYPALAQPHVDVVPAGLREVRGRTLVASDGSEREVDTIIFGTGFEVSPPPVTEMVFGRDGRRLADLWRDSGVSALRGTTVAGFPNLFVLIGPNTGFGHTSMVYVIESQLRYVLDALRIMARDDLATVEARPQAQQRWDDRMQRRLTGTVWNTGGCGSWYVDSRGRNGITWPGASWQLRRSLRSVDLAEYDVVARHDAGRPALTVVAPAGVAPEEVAS